MALTGRLGLLALLGALVVGLVLPSWTGIWLVGVVLLAAALVDLALAGGVRGLAFTRSSAASVRLGKPVEVTLTIGNAGRRAVRGVLRDAWPPSAAAEVDRHRIAIPAGEHRNVVTRLLPTRRGDRPASRVTVRSLGPLGLAGRQVSHDVPWSVRVLPPFHSRKHLPSRLARLQQMDGRNAVLIRGQGTEFDSLREYVIGDDVRSIDWRATARRADVVVRTWRPARDRRGGLVVDPGGPSG